jgi:hypothetical protein
MLQTQNIGVPLGLLMNQCTPMLPFVDDKDFFINYMAPGQTGPAGPPGPQGPAGTVTSVPVTLIDEATYTPTANEYFLGIIYDGTVTITLPSSVAGKVYIIKDSLGDSSTNHTTIVASIDGAASYVLNIDWSSVTLIYNGIEWNVV